MKLANKQVFGKLTFTFFFLFFHFFLVQAHPPNRLAILAPFLPYRFSIFCLIAYLLQNCFKFTKLLFFFFLAELISP
jgi:hypothetical protein